VRRGTRSTGGPGPFFILGGSVKDFLIGALVLAILVAAFLWGALVLWIVAEAVAG